MQRCFTVESSINDGYQFNAGREGQSQKEVPHFDPLTHSVVNVVESQIFIGKLAHKFMTSTTATK